MTRHQMTSQELIQFMRDTKLTDEKLISNLIGVTPQAVTLWLHGKRRIPETVRRMILLFKKYPGLLKERFV